MGKTSLVRALLEHHDVDAHVLFGVCDDLLTQRPLGPVWDMALDEPTLAEALAVGQRGAVYDEMLRLMTRSLRPTIVVM